MGRLAGGAGRLRDGPGPHQQDRGQSQEATDTPSR
jgi:hypothetical protein